MGTRSVALTGQPTAGKSTALSLIGDRAGSKWRVLRVHLPHGDDGGPVAMASVAAQLGTETLEVVRDVRVSWSAKIREVTCALERMAEESLLLFDEPQYSVPNPSASIFVRRAEEMTAALLSIPNLRSVVATERKPVYGQETIVVQRASDVAAILAPAQWNGLGDHAKALLDTDAPELARYSPLELRLGVALLAAGVPAQRLMRERWLARQLIRTLVDTLDDSEALKRVAGRLAVYRTSFGEAALQRAGIGDLSPTPRSILESALLFGKPGARRLHELVAMEARARKWLTPADEMHAHREAAAYYRGCFEDASTADNLTDSVRYEMEMVHHLTEAGDEAAMNEAHVFFVDQYDALGKSFSLRRRFELAVRAYERSLSHDDEDHYAHHYLGYNYDVRGLSPLDVEKCYRRAVEIEPTHTWYHSRLICFLITRGRALDARRQWAEAHAALLPSGSYDDERLYRDLHMHVARLLLHRGQLRFAEEVLEDVVPEFQQHPWWLALQRLLLQLKEAERDETVFPPHIPVEQRWSGPHLVRAPEERRRVRRWFPGRVAAIDQSGVHVRIAIADGRDAAIEYGWRDFSNKEFRQLSPLAARGLSLPVGTFVEIVEFKKGRQRGRTMIFAHESQTYVDPALPGLFPAPDRYLRVSAKAPS